MIYWLICQGRCNDRAKLHDVREYQAEAVRNKHQYGRQANPHPGLTHTLRSLVYTAHKKRNAQTATCTTCEVDRRYG